MRRLPPALFAIVLTSGCVGPAISLSSINSAQAELAAARTADAPKWAPYEFTLAEMYLTEAKEKFAYSGSYYEESATYAKKSYLLAHQAKEKALDHPKD
jgi:Domain of unknown function (DUF4398)